MNPVVHFEMPAEDRKRMAEFYTKVFDWKTEQLGEDMGNYVLAATTESDENGPIRRCAINGGFFQKTEDKPAQYPSVVIAVEDITARKEVGERRRPNPWRTMGYPRSGAIRIFSRYRGQQGRDDSADHELTAESIKKNRQKMTA